MLTVHVALVSDTDAVSKQEITRVAAALDKQVTRDFGPLWGVRATHASALRASLSASRLGAPPRASSPAAARSGASCAAGRGRNGKS